VAQSFLSLDVCFDTLTPPRFQELDIHFDDKDKQNKYKRRVGFIHPGHERVAPYAYQLRVVLSGATTYDILDRFGTATCDILDRFQKLSSKCGISEAAIIRCRTSNNIEAKKFGFFAPDRIYKLKKTIAKFSWGVAFQLEALLHNGILHTEDVEDLLPRVSRLCTLHPQNNCQYAALFLRGYTKTLRERTARESPTQCFEKTRKEYAWLDSKLPKGNFMCCNVTFTPSRILMEGPQPIQSNRIIREYEGFEEHFIRVDFTEENRLAYRWERTADYNTLIEERVGAILKNGFDLAGRHFEFLAYSSSSLRDHSVWFVNPFEHPFKGYARPQKKKRLVNAEYIRETIGDFKGTQLLRCPSKYAARLGQAFTATDPSVRIPREEFEEVPDIGQGDYIHTDGVGTISKSLGDEIWAKLQRSGSKVKPSAVCQYFVTFGNVVYFTQYQIRFMGYKGVVSVDEKLDEDGKGIRMRLRDSMKKFENSEEKMPEIEIAQDFHHPNVCYLNRFVSFMVASWPLTNYYRPFIMFLEDLGVKRESFERLQDEAVADARTIHNSIESFCRILDMHNLGGKYHLSYTLKRLKERHGLDLHPQNDVPGVDNQFLQQVREVAMVTVLRDIKHGARIPVPESYLLVGVADEGPAYEMNGHKDVFTLGEGQIYGR
jgi:RNA-dependent RNA polymerase